jgi:predicted O-linked N-acetylglucosamine transferase (SPINDLY family)
MPSDSIDQLIDSGIGQLQADRLADAQGSFTRALEISPGHSDALNFLGVALFKQNKADEARSALERAIAADPGSADAHYNLAEVLNSVGEANAADQNYLRCAELDPSHPMAWRRLAEARAARRDHRGAVQAASRFMEQTPGDVELMFWTAQQMILGGEVQEASGLLRKAAMLAPDDLQKQVYQFNTAARASDVEGALEGIERAMKIAPDSQKVLLARLLLFSRLGRLQDAVEAGRDYIRRFPEDADAHYTLGCIFESQKELGGAALAFARFIDLKPDAAIGYARLGNVLLHIGHLRDAEMQLTKAIELDEKLVPPRMHLSYVLEKLPGRMGEAMAQVRKVIEINPKDTDAINALATLMTRDGKHSDAAQTYRQALEIDPKSVGALLGYGGLLAGQGRITLAWEHFERAMANAPEASHPCSTALFFANGHPDLSSEQLFVLHQRWARLFRREQAASYTSWNNDQNPDRRLKIGYMSPDLRSHSVAYFLQPLFAAHDKTQVEVIVLDNTPTSDPISLHLSALADRWHRIVGAGAQRVAEMVRDLQVDILIDLAGHTSDNRLDIFVLRPAPIQVSYLGYPNTTGLEEIQYHFTDDLADPPGADTYYCEKLIRLPGGFLCFNPPPPAQEIGSSPAGLSGNVTFGSFNAVHKINYKVIGLWARVLHAAPSSRLLLKAAGLADPETRQTLLDSFASEDIGEDRLVFVERTVGYRDHLAIYGQVDISLDTFPYNGTTTTCEALWMGVPVIALAGKRHAARVSLDILTRLDLPELVAQDQDEYVRIAANLANDRARLIELRSTLRPRMLKSRLMDGKAHARALEDAYRQMWKTWCASSEAARQIPGKSPP